VTSNSTPNSVTGNRLTATPTCTMPLSQGTALDTASPVNFPSSVVKRFKLTAVMYAPVTYAARIAAALRGWFVGGGALALVLWILRPNDGTS
jgi:hypothetical protein